MFNKSYYSLTLMLLLFLLSSCSKDNKIVSEIDQPDLDQVKVDEDVKTVSFNVSNYIVDGALTKTDIDGNNFVWTSGDTVGIYPNTGAQVYFAVNAGQSASSASFDGGGWGFKTSATYYGYYPFIGNIYLDRTKIPVSYSGQKQVGQSTTSHMGPYDYMYTLPTSASSGSLNFTFKHLNSIVYFIATLPAGTYTKMAITAPSELFTSKGYFNLMSSSPVIVPTDYTNQITIDLENITLTAQTTFNVYFMCAPVNLNGIEVTVSALNSERKEYQCKKTPSRAYVAGTIYYLTCSSFSEVPQSMGLIIDDWGDGGDIGGTAD
ncbi:MAG: hypothetical protein IK103_05590 [Bacteroidales bacterium]|nr:hypothetical protein [Bacteroidales bacterium]